MFVPNNLISIKQIEYFNGMDLERCVCTFGVVDFCIGRQCQAYCQDRISRKLFAGHFV